MQSSKQIERTNKPLRNMSEREAFYTDKDKAKEATKQCRNECRKAKRNF